MITKMTLLRMFENAGGKNRDIFLQGDSEATDITCTNRTLEGKNGDIFLQGDSEATDVTCRNRNEVVYVKKTLIEWAIIENEQKLEK